MDNNSDTLGRKPNRARTLASEDATIQEGASCSDTFDIEAFFPYLVRVYYKSVSETVKSVYFEGHSLKASEWRTMAVVGPVRKLSAREIVGKSSMDKVSVSRAVSGLRAKGLMTQSIDETDRRRSVLELTKEGCKTYHDLIPRVRKAEKQLLAELTETEQAELLRLMSKVRTAANSILD